MSFLRDLKIAVRSLSRVRALWITVVLTLALGIGANAAIFSVVRGVLLRPLVNRDQDTCSTSARARRGIGIENANFSVPEFKDLAGRVKTLSALRATSPPSSSRWSAWASRASCGPAWSAALTSR